MLITLRLIVPEEVADTCKSGGGVVTLRVAVLAYLGFLEEVLGAVLEAFLEAFLEVANLYIATAITGGRRIISIDGMKG